MRRRGAQVAERRPGRRTASSRASSPSSRRTAPAVVIGTGLNVGDPRGRAAGLARPALPATSLLARGGHGGARERCCSRCCASLERVVRRLPGRPGPGAHRPARRLPSAVRHPGAGGARRAARSAAFMTGVASGHRPRRARLLVGNAHDSLGRRRHRATGRSLGPGRPLRSTVRTRAPTALPCRYGSRPLARGGRGVRRRCCTRTGRRSCCPVAARRSSSSPCCWSGEVLIPSEQRRRRIERLVLAAWSPSCCSCGG